MLATQVSSPNFYYEGVLSIETCGERDFYGLIFRADGPDFYMFAITCDGNFRLLRRLDGSEDLLNIAASPGVPLGPGQHRLGVSVHGKQIGLYVAGELIHEQREQRLDQIPQGSFGVYARAVSTGLLKVRWDDLMATEILP